MSFRITVQLVFDSTFELGHAYHFAIERVLDGDLPALLVPQPGRLTPTDGVLMVPPWPPGGGDWGLGRSARRATLRLAAPVAMETLEARSADPGRGLGDFLPPLVLAADGQALEMLEIVLAEATGN